MTAANWISLLVAVAGFAITFGAMQAKVAHLREHIERMSRDIDNLKEGRTARGVRIGEMERQLAVLIDRSEQQNEVLPPRRRRPTLSAAPQKAIPPEESDDS